MNWAQFQVQFFPKEFRYLVLKTKCAAGLNHNLVFESSMPYFLLYIFIHTWITLTTFATVYTSHISLLQAILNSGIWCVQWNRSWETSVMRHHLSWKTRYSWQKVLHFSVHVIEPVTMQRPPVLRDHICMANGVVFQESFYCVNLNPPIRACRQVEERRF